jgi:uncharacterized protein (TIGR02646 family)
MMRFVRPSNASFGLRASSQREALFRRDGTIPATSSAVYRRAKMALYRAQNRKCAWCDLRFEQSSHPVEHYRPKDGAYRHPTLGGAMDADVYWWLAYSWSNLLFACVTCNDHAHKGNYFPVRRPVAAPGPLTPLPSVDAEDALLLDPARDNPSDHFRWTPVDADLPPSLWTWRIKASSLEGEVTARVLNLDMLAERVGDHVRRHLLARVEETNGHVAAGRRTEAGFTWDRLLMDCLDDPSAELRAATWHALRRLVPDPASLGLRVPRDPHG